MNTSAFFFSISIRFGHLTRVHSTLKLERKKINNNKNSLPFFLSIAHSVWVCIKCDWKLNHELSYYWHCRLPINHHHKYLWHFSVSAPMYRILSCLLAFFHSLTVIFMSLLCFFFSGNIRLITDFYLFQPFVFDVVGT